MIYLKQSFNLHPASPATRDRFALAVEKSLIPANEPLGARLVAGWFCHEEWFTQIVNVTEFPDLASFAEWRAAARADSALSDAVSALKALAPERRAELLEPLGPIEPAALQAAIEASASEPVGTYTFAILEVSAGQLEAFSAMLGSAKGALPIIACWRDVAGNPNRIIDLWKGDTGAMKYRPTDDRQDAFFEPLRKIAPRERMMRLHPMPYSLLQ